MSDIRNKKIKIILIILSILIIISSVMLNKYEVKAKTNIGESKLVLEVNSNRVLYQSNAQEKKFMASTTKILTAICIIENCDLDEIITINKKDTGIEGSSIYLEEGEKLSVKDLLYGLMLRSGNDCAVALANHCSGSIENFALLMNQTAQKIGAVNSNFVNPHGLHDDNHFTTAYDLALISSYSIKNPVFKEIVSTKRIKIPHTTKGYDRILINKNKMLNEFEGSTGIKTGYTKNAGRCLVTSCLRNGMELICVVLNCGPMFEESKSLLTNSFNEYKLYKIVESDNIIDFICDKNNMSYALHVKKDLLIPLTEMEYENLEIEYNFSKTVDFILSHDKEVGNVKIIGKNGLLFEEKIYTI